MVKLFKTQSNNVETKLLKLIFLKLKDTFSGQQ